MMFNENGEQTVEITLEEYKILLLAYAELITKENYENYEEQPTKIYKRKNLD